MAFTGIFCSSYMAINPMVKSELHKQDLDTRCWCFFFFVAGWTWMFEHVLGIIEIGDMLPGWSWFVGYAASI